MGLVTSYSLSPPAQSPTASSPALFRLTQLTGCRVSPSTACSSPYNILFSHYIQNSLRCFGRLVNDEPSI